MDVLSQATSRDLAEFYSAPHYVPQGNRIDALNISKMYLELDQVEHSELYVVGPTLSETDRDACLAEIKAHTTAIKGEVITRETTKQFANQRFAAHTILISAISTNLRCLYQATTCPCELFEHIKTHLESNPMDNNPTIILCQVLMKPQWWVKMQDVSILAKWKAESALSDNDLAFSCGTHGVFMTDHLVESGLLRWIQALTAPLEAEARARGNFHPSDHSDLYPQLASLFELMLPMFETCLGSADAQPRHRIAHINMDQVMPTNKSECPRQAFFAQRRLDNPNSVTDGDELEDDVFEFAKSFDETNVPLFLPALPTDEFETQFPSVKLNNNTLQVIVKIAFIELTPHKSTYPGGSWHVEGMIHESIAASGILYYDYDNVTPSKLWFRHAFEPDYEFEYEQDEHTAITATRLVEILKNLTSFWPII
ncbi:hypothetical protein DYB25_008869 [Aphanomyces astaci]|uniref:DUF4246 domain-containing protein n=1 Tax=Aphanomyces astaci TaxID=112090 RepID=A0A397B1H8_APHAT|nr:hypothetical protein DYB25_008869 [Aphanomyces astaci]